MRYEVEKLPKCNCVRCAQEQNKSGVMLKCEDCSENFDYSIEGTVAIKSGESLCGACNEFREMTEYFEENYWLGGDE